MPRPAITLTHDRIELRGAGLSESHPFDSAQQRELEQITAAYQQAADRDDAEQILTLGQRLFAWLDGPSNRFLTRLRQSAPRPLLVDFVVAHLTDDDAREKAFLEAPWEILAVDGVHWGPHKEIRFSPVRRLGAPGTPPAPNSHCLGVVFMAAAPRTADNLSYEAEEALILKATEGIAMDLAVEESGTLALFAHKIAREKPDVAAISCHGQLHPVPALILEGDGGDRDDVTTTDLIARLAAHQPRLLVLSACQTAEPDPVLDSLARSLVRAGLPAVFGWAAPVLDHEAAVFAASLYRHLAEGIGVAEAVAAARFDLVRAFHDAKTKKTRSADWHLARLYLNPEGGGVLATADGQRRHLRQRRAVKAFLDAKGQVPVASEYEFVGRRRKIQEILREFANPRHDGVLITGMGGNGKSSLAARVAHRLQQSHHTALVFGSYDAPSILKAFAENHPAAAIHGMVEKHLPLVEADSKKLLPALVEILNGVCGQNQKDANGQWIAHPVLLVVDDFERALVEDSDELKPELVDPIRALLQAFHNAETQSRLLFTCRRPFRLPTAGQDLAARLLRVPLSGMDDHEAWKHRSAVLQAANGGDVTKGQAQLLARATAVARGNPRLHRLLLNLALQDPAACAQCLDPVEAYLQGGELPADEAVRKVVENLAVAHLLGLLAPLETEVLRRMQVFSYPAPVPVVRALAANVAGSSSADAPVERLLSLGLLEVWEDAYHPHRPAYSANRLAIARVGELSEDEKRQSAAVVAGPLFEDWGGAGVFRAGSALDLELVRLALVGQDHRVLAGAGAGALRFLNKEFQYKQAAALARQIMAILDTGQTSASLDLLRTAAECCQQVGDVKQATALRQRALEIVEQSPGGDGDSVNRFAALLDHARALVQQGKPTEAVQYLESARAALPAENRREHAIITGEMARIRAARGEVEAALALHQEELGVYEELGDKRSRAVTLGDIAGIRAARGEVEAALALHQEKLRIMEELGDKRERAVTLGDIARIRADRGELDAALALHQEALGVYEELGAKRERAVTLGDIARIRAARGEVEAALGLHQEKLRIMEELGDKRSRAVTLGDIARIRAARGEVEAALGLHQEKLRIMEELGDKRERAVTLGYIARIRAARGEVEAALALHQEALGVYEELGDKRSRAVTLGYIARIRAARGEVEAALVLHQEALGVYEELGDKRERAVTLGYIARIRAARGEVEAALALHQEALGVYEELGAKRDRAVTLGDIARIRAARGEVEAALALHQEGLDQYRELGDADGIASAQWGIAQIELSQDRLQDAFPRLAESYGIFLQIGRLDAICIVGLTLGHILCANGRRKEGRAILTRSRDGFLHLQHPQFAAKAQALLDQFPDSE